MKQRADSRLLKAPSNCPSRRRPLRGIWRKVVKRQVATQGSATLVAQLLGGRCWQMPALRAPLPITSGLNEHSTRSVVSQFFSAQELPCASLWPRIAFVVMPRKSTIHQAPKAPHNNLHDRIQRIWQQPRFGKRKDQHLESADLLLPTKTEFHVMTHNLSSFVTLALSPYNAMGIAVPA